jgi:hypothetical protein
MQLSAHAQVTMAIARGPKLPDPATTHWRRDFAWKMAPRQQCSPGRLGQDQQALAFRATGGWNDRLVTLSAERACSSRDVYAVLGEQATPFPLTLFGQSQSVNLSHGSVGLVPLATADGRFLSSWTRRDADDLSDLLAGIIAGHVLAGIGVIPAKAGRGQVLVDEPVDRGLGQRYRAILVQPSVKVAEDEE